MSDLDGWLIAGEVSCPRCTSLADFDGPVAELLKLISEHDCATDDGLAQDARRLDVLERSAPYPNRRDPGVRMYLTLQIAEERG
jgi:hypothetical protein